MVHRIIAPPLLALAGVLLLGAATVHGASFEAKLTASDAASGDRFGLSVGASGDTMVIGAPYDGDAGTNSGAAYVFRSNGGQWLQEAKLTASDASDYDYFGWSVAVSGDVAVIGAYGGDHSAYVFRWNGAQWLQEAKLNSASGDSFGWSVGVSGDVVVIGDWSDDDAGASSGSAYVFRWNGAQWLQEAKLTASDAAGGDFFGDSVGVSGDVAVIGAWGDNHCCFRAGSAYVYRWNGAQWLQEAKLTASDAAREDEFGISVGVSGDVAVVGAQWDDDAGSNSGSAYVYRWNGAQWLEEAKLTASDAASGDLFGENLGVSGDVAVIGGLANDDAGASSGSAYVYRWNGAQWLQEAKLTASDAASGDFFGGSVGVSGDVAVIGASGDDDAGSASGSAYVYDGSDADGDDIRWVDNCPNLSNPSQANHDGDVDGDACDDDDDNDGVFDINDTCPLGETGWVSGPNTDHDGDGCQDDIEDDDNDNDGVSNALDACPRGVVAWAPDAATDHDGDGCRDADEDLDDDNDDVPDEADACPRGEVGWTSSSAKDFDGDGCRDAGEDLDDDNDGVPDEEDVCPLDANCPPAPPSDLRATLAEGPGNIRLTWATSPNPDIQAYRVYRGTTPTELAFHIEVGNVTSVVDQALTYGLTYHYAVSAVTAGEGKWSGVANATFLDEEPPSLGVTWPDLAWWKETVVLGVVEWDVPTGLEACSVMVESAGLVSVDAARPCNATHAVAVGPSGACRDEGLAACRVTLSARDWVGNVAVAEATTSVDYTPPATARSLAGQPGLEGWWTSNVEVALTCSDATSGCASTAWDLDGREGVDGGPFSISGDGVHDLAYWSEDVAGNVEAAHEILVPIDRTPPVTGSSLDGSAGLDGWWTSPVEVCLHPADATSGVAVTRVRLDGGALEDGGCRTFDEDGRHVMTYWSVDVAGNVEVARSLEVKVDQRPPATTRAVTGVAGLAGWWVSEVEVALSCDDETSGCGETFLAAGGAEPTAGSNFQFHDGVHDLAYHSVDVAGNKEVPSEFALMVDTTPPEVSLIEPAEGQAYLFDYLIPNPTPQYTWLIGGKTIMVDAFDAMSGVERVEFWIDDKLGHVAFEAPYEWQWEAGAEVQGNHTIRVVAYDVAGNGASDEREVLTLPTSTSSLLGPAPPLPQGWEETVLLDQVIPLPGDDIGFNEIPLDLLEVRGEPDPEDTRFYLLYVRILGEDPPVLNPLRVLTGVTLPPVHIRLVDVPGLAVPLADGSVALRLTLRYDPEQGLCPVSGGPTCLTPLPFDPLDLEWLLARGARAALVAEAVVAIDERPLGEASPVPVLEQGFVLGETVVVPFAGQAAQTLDEIDA